MNLREIIVTGGSAFGSGLILDKFVGGGTIEAGIIKVGGAYFLGKDTKNSDKKGIVYGVGVDGVIDILSALSGGIGSGSSGAMETL